MEPQLFFESQGIFQRRFPGAVSYTHLDVYKRQISTDALQQKEGLLPCRFPCHRGKGFFQLVKALSQGHHWSSCPSSGSTSFKEASATSSWPSSGSQVVSRCSQSPGADMMRVKMLS